MASKLTPKVKKEAKKLKLKKNEKNDTIIHEKDWFMRFDAPLKIILTARFFAAFLVHISDCDETFNYWEPTHYFVFNSGFQTWEYAPPYALRSYLYILIHAVPVYLYKALFNTRKIMLFYLIRCVLALLSSLCELYFYKAISKKISSTVSNYYLFITVFSPGMFIASTAYLPSSFSMYMTFLIIGAWLNKNYEFAIFTTALSTFLSWPFSCLIGLPLACDIIFKNKKYMLFIKWCFISLGSILVYQVATDSYFYGKFVIAPFNIVFYNLFTSHGPDLYGTEHWSFYVLNGVLNFNVVFILSLMAPIAIVLRKILTKLGIRFSKQSNINNNSIWILYLSPLYLWIFVFILQPHKEERFLFPVYPLIQLASSILLEYIKDMNLHSSVINRFSFLKLYNKLIDNVYIPFLFVFLLMGLSRSILLVKAYHAPIDTYTQLSNDYLTLPESDVINVCVGKEWHRYPSSFFLPNDRWKMHFIRSEFRGLLPGRFSQESLYKVVENYNDQNKEELDKYSDIRLCHFLIDLNNNQSSELEPNYSENNLQWTIWKSIPFLDSKKTPTLYRTFYFPFFWEENVKFSSYNLLMRNDFNKMNTKAHAENGSPINYGF
ncbi:alpha-1,2-mannosyltransferase ALG9 isoform X1 [Rhopalosiphum maidis]|uniref:alpha-1,2-mannosyltransferase ALG9 isoform X1 n=2 Tax=Rhopalosiphum maidis TaxID=43146 RepID=UPI000F00BABB|nr:alpha-1,2-mannosyltransferase ALG9 isoform X1 [Rhopalosiphum maidis]XP_026811554.1 alpha-1,2-mannosyltransferase ALG9 isoform X1 [Rhopalosiphum maidis]